MKWVVVSDNHGSSEPLTQLQSMYPDADGFIHCGDSEMPASQLSGFFAVLGNNDYDRDLPQMLIVTMGKHRAMVVHGDQAGFSSRLENLAKQALSHHCDLVLFGHTHVFSDDVVLGVRIMNPGSVYRSRDGRGKTYGVLESSQDAELTFTFHQYEPPASKLKRRLW